MAKYITNTSLGIISIGDKNFIPGAARMEVTDAEASHPAIVKYIAAGKLKLVEEVATVATAATATTITDLDSMTVDQLKAYAIENKIDLGTATVKADIIAAIKASTKS